MPKEALVTIRYGPYKACWVVDFRTFRLEGLRAALEEDGHRCILEPFLDWNTVELVVKGESVFKCNIKEFDFGGDGLLDPLCAKAVIAVRNAY
ncbi:UPF0728 protein C10orf53 homolog [Callorhinchus milii]|uniref:Chromosome 10 open reading frame 53 n=2 Tax=Callorhinchus milii TaxID=7868 RepID=A0A4W3HAS2_CALMI|nr:UPF0728 protein C10orf53 homolog [Callorhinchus milii]|eukprot:gi/632936904/ref/XP_007896568.1/ PREDICTED: UPF0728 protein C10orf53 homolog isoform X2 [Callorhinchus milii]